MQQQTYNDGVLTVYAVDNIANDGDMPIKGLTIKHSCIRYEERTVGMSRFWTACQQNTNISQMLRIPRIESIHQLDVVIPNDGNQYQIKQLQYINDVTPMSIDLSLERVDADYDIKGD